MLKSKTFVLSVFDIISRLSTLYLLPSYHLSISKVSFAVSHNFPGADQLPPALPGQFHRFRGHHGAADAYGGVGGGGNGGSWRWMGNSLHSSRGDLDLFDLLVFFSYFSIFFLWLWVLE